ncbi:hypothetical protein [Nocardiopsis dassonvillei]|uniref:hypothetical protein n=1 Tax=Nocardiopsis dassonvillei TaxID=2014 RepID=UPI003F55A43A
MSPHEFTGRLRAVVAAMPTHHRTMRLVLVVMAVATALTITIGAATPLLVLALVASGLGTVVAAGELVLLALDDNFDQELEGEA